MKRLENKVKYWIDNNIGLIHKVIDGTYSFGDDDIVSFVSEFKYDDDLNHVATMLFKELVFRSHDYCVKQHYDTAVFNKTVAKIASFASLNEYTKEVDFDYLIKLFSLELCEELIFFDSRGGI